MSPNRIVAVLTPLVFAPLAGACAAWLSQHFPGVDVDKDALQEIFIAGALIALAPAAQWLHGWQKYEARQGELTNALAIASAGTAGAGGAAGAEGPVTAEIVDEELEWPDELDQLDALDDLDDLDESSVDDEDPAEAWA